MSRVALHERPHLIIIISRLRQSSNQITMRSFIVALLALVLVSANGQEQRRLRLADDKPVQKFRGMQRDARSLEELATEFEQRRALKTEGKGKGEETAAPSETEPPTDAVVSMSYSMSMSMSMSYSMSLSMSM